MSERYEPDDIFRAISGACDNDILVSDDPERYLQVEGYLDGVGQMTVYDEDAQPVARYRVTIDELAVSDG